MGPPLHLTIRVRLENVEELKTSHPDFDFSLKLKCTACGEISDTWHDVIESEKYLNNNGRSENNYIAKCKMCKRVNCLDIVPGSNASYTKEDSEKFKTIVSFDCRGIQPVDFKPGEGWIVTAEGSGTVFKDVDLSEKLWADYDERANQSVGVYDFEYKIC